MLIQINDQKITEKLVKIRERLGLEISNFIPRPWPDRIEEDIEGKDIFSSLLHPSGLLIHNNWPVFVYIRDHTIIGNYTRLSDWDPANGNRVHFSFCRTLQDMKNKGMFESRYRMTNRDNNLYSVEVLGGRELQRPLYPCKNCLYKVDFSCYRRAESRQEKDDIVRTFSPKHAIDFLFEYQRLYKFSSKTKQLSLATGYVGYADNHKKISRRVREKNNYICQECKANLNDYRSLTHLHHIDGDKRNNRDENFQCLCKVCHAEIHPHMSVSDHERQIIERCRPLS